MEKTQVDSKKPKETKQNQHLGFVLATVFLIAAIILFYGWETFGNETALKITAAVFLLISLWGYGVEISNYTKDDGALEATIGLSFTFFILMIKNALPGTPNLVVLAFILFGLLFIGVSITRLFPLKNIKLPNINGEDTPKLNKLKYFILGGQVVGVIVNVVNFIRLFL